MSWWRASWLAGCSLALLGGCQPGEAPARDQWLVVMSTDAPVPQFGDRVAVEVIDEHGDVCDACRHQIPAGSESRWPLSFAVLPPNGGGELIVRAVLYRTDHVGFDGVPVGAAHIEASGVLPAVSSVTRVALELRMDCLGLPDDIGARLSCDASSGTLAPLGPLAAVEEGAPTLMPGSWPQAQATECVTPAPEGMVCVPGGAFLLGSVHGLTDDDQPERLVQLPPFAIDELEVTAKEVESLYADGKISRAPLTTGSDPMSLEAACSFDPASSAKDELPANCLDHALAQEICAALDKRLPSEAEWEWAAGNRTQETTYPWGDDGDTVCDDAVIGRGRSPAEVSVAVIESDACRGLAGGEGVPWGPVSDPAGRDVAELGIHHLAGNVAEYTSDLFAAYDDTCWRPEERLLVDPHCVIAAGNIAPVSVRGGGWSGLRVQARVYERDAAASGATPPNTGVRCALSLAP